MAVGVAGEQWGQEGSAGMAFVLALSVLNSLDAAFTATFVRLGMASEANPLMAVLIASSPPLFVGVKLVLVNGGALCLWLLRQSRVARIALRTCVLAYAAVVAYHLSFVGRVAF